MANLQLITGNRNHSASSLRPWLLLQEFGIPFEEDSIRLFRPDTTEKIALVSPSLQLPVLVHGDIRVWDSLAICEYIAETMLEGRGWPASARARAAARAIANELHSDFSHFQQEWPLNCRYKGRLKASVLLEQEIARLDAIIACCRRQYGKGDGYLFGNFCIVDCMLAPFAIALNAYGAELTGAARSYVDFLLQNPWLQSWLDDAMNEIEDSEVISIGQRA